MNGDVTFHRDRDRHEDRAGHHDRLAGVEELRKQGQVQPGGQVEADPETFEDGAEQIAGVEKRQRDEHLKNIFVLNSFLCSFLTEIL